MFRVLYTTFNTEPMNDPDFGKARQKELHSY